MNNSYILKKFCSLFFILTLCSFINCYLTFKFINIHILPLILISLSIYLLIFKRTSLKEQFSIVKPTLYLNKLILISTVLYIIFIIVLFFTLAAILFPSNPYDNLNWIAFFTNSLYLITGAFQEEIVFRLYAFYELRKFSLKKQIIISSFIFSIVHLISPILYCNLFNFKSLLILLFTFSTGIFLAVIYTKNKNLIQVSLIHLFINISTSLIPIFFIDVLAINLFQSIISFIFLLSSFLIFKSIKSIS